MLRLVEGAHARRKFPLGPGTTRCSSSIGTPFFPTYLGSLLFMERGPLPNTLKGDFLSCNSGNVTEYVERPLSKRALFFSFFVLQAQSLSMADTVSFLGKTIMFIEGHGSD